MSGNKIQYKEKIKRKMKFAKIFVYFLINFSSSLQKQHDIIENVDEIEEPKTLDGVPIDEVISLNMNVHKKPIAKLLDNKDSEILEANLGKQSNLNNKVIFDVDLVDKALKKKLDIGQKEEEEEYHDEEKMKTRKKTLKNHIDRTKKTVDSFSIDKLSVTDDASSLKLSKKNGLFFSQRL